MSGRSRLLSGAVAAPHLMPVEGAKILRRAALRGDISADTAALAHGDLLDLPLQLLPYDLVAAHAELLDAQLVTLDERLARPAGISAEHGVRPTLPPATTPPRYCGPADPM